jgi:hypothetical protein
MSSAERWFALLLQLYPPDFRDEMGGGLVDAYRRQTEEAKKRGGASVAVVWLAALIDSLWNGLGERIKPAVQWRRGGDWGRDMEVVTRRLRQKPLFFTAVLGTLTVGLGMHLLAGRDFEPSHHEGVYEALIDQHLAAQFFPNGSPIGATLQVLGDGPNREFFPRIVGVVDQARLHASTRMAARRSLFAPKTVPAAATGSSPFAATAIRKG